MAEQESSLKRKAIEYLVIAVLGYFGINANFKADEAIEADPQWTAVAEDKAEIAVLKFRVEQLEKLLQEHLKEVRLKPKPPVKKPTAAAVRDLRKRFTIKR